MRVLFIDDDRSLLDLVVLGFGADTDAMLCVASDAGEALGLLRSQAYDVILLDAVMPDVCGPDLLAQILSTVEDPPPVFYITALALDHQRASLLETGAAGVITKPFDPFSLPRRVRHLVNAVERAQTQNSAALAA